jgi:hypothetical protein
MQARLEREDHPDLFVIEMDPLAADLLPVETDPLPACLRAAPRVEPERPTRWVWIILGVALLFGFVFGGGYWLSQRGQIPVAAVVAPPTTASAKLVPTAAAPPATLSAPQLAVGLPGLSRQTTTGTAAPQSPAPPPSQPAQLAVGLRPITGQSPSSAPAPVAEAPPPAEPLPPPPKPHRKASAHQTSPGANPDQSSNFVRF